MQKVVKALRDLAYDKIRGLDPNEIDPIDALNSLDWSLDASLPQQQYDLALANQRLDERFCLGRAAKAAAYVENWFPHAELYFAEVRQDALRDLILSMMGQNPTIPEIQELLMYEEPHGIIVVNNKQFDPLSQLMHEPIKHPSIAQVTVWEGLTAEWLSSRSLLCESNEEKLAMLQYALELSPDSTNVKAMRAALYFEMGKDGHALADLRQVVRLRPNVRSLFFASMFGDKHSEQLLYRTYPMAVIDYVENEFQLIVNHFSKSLTEVN